MQKDENDLFPVFIKYYGKAFEHNQIHVFDNGSSRTMNAALDHARSLGVHVNLDYDTPQDFERKGAIVGEAINANQDNYDVFLPLDCDEFIGLKNSDGTYSCDVNDLMSFFGSLAPGAYRTTERVRNNLSDLERFFVYRGKAKIFVVKTPVAGLDVGFHGCKKPDTVADSPLCHFELHNKPFDVLQQHARNKMELRVDVDDMDALNQYSGKGIHLIRFLRKNAKAHYFAGLEKQTWFHTQALQQAFAKIGLKHPFADKEHTTMNTSEIAANTPSQSDVDKLAKPKFPMTFPKEVADFLRKTYREATGIVEYGSGGSTLHAARLGKPFISIESDRKWTDEIQKTVAGIGRRHQYSNVCWIDIGKTKEWGFPVDTQHHKNYWKYPLSAWTENTDFTPDVVLIDGRMRKACFCAALAMTKKPIRVLFDDYRKRTIYHEVECLIKPTSLIGRMAVFDVKPGLVSVEDLPTFLPWFSEVW